MKNSFIPTEDLKVSERIYKTKINGLFYIHSPAHKDERGFFSEIAIIDEIEKQIGTSFKIRQLNHTRSNTRVTRGMHAEDWNKLITVTSGIVFSALADVNPDSSTFLSVETFMLGVEENTLQGSLFISKGIANSLCVIKGPVDYIYAVDKAYKERDKKGDMSISLFDTDLNIKWPIKREDMIISKRDKESITLRERFPEYFLKR